MSAAGTVVDLAPSLEGVPPAPATFTPAANDRTHTTRATAVADRRMRPMQEVRAGFARDRVVEVLPRLKLDRRSMFTCSQMVRLP